MHLDGLRGLSILFVFLYHLKLFEFPGFIGVDIFFVLSGFLIINIVKRQCLNNSFSLLAFYNRRIRRIVPITLLVITATLFVGFYTLLPMDYIDLCKSAVSSLFFISNFYFWRTQNYFSDDTSLYPLIHTWSLGIEEQFYFFIFIFSTLFIKYPRIINKFFIISILLSLINCLYFSYIGKSFSFYTLPFRMWEIMLGGFLAIHFSNSLLREKNLSSFVIDLSIIVFTVSIFFVHHFGFHPGPFCLFVCLFTCYLITNGSNSKILNFIPLVYLGKISFTV